jgi:hypothetical protein
LRLPSASVATYPTVVIPTGKQFPDEKLLDTEGSPQLSVAVGAAHCALAHESIVESVMFAGQLAKTGFIVSPKHGFLTVTVNEQGVAKLYFESLPS